MVKKSAIKSAFESLCRSKEVYTSFGIFPAASINICIIPAGSLFCVSLIKAFFFNGELHGWTSARSFPMTYKSAYRLVCSL